MALDYEKSKTAPLNKVKSWRAEIWGKLAALSRKIILDNYAVIIFVLVIVTVLLIFIFFWSPVWGILTLGAPFIYSWIKDFRDKILFKKSGTSVSVNDGPKVLFWILDGCNIPAFLDVARTNPDLKTMFEEGFFAQCTTIFPSITPAAHSSLMAGCYPSKTRVPAFDWVEISPGLNGLQKKAYVRVMPDFKRFRKSVSNKKAREEFFHGLGDAMDLNQRYLSPMVTTIFEARGKDFCTSSVTEWIHRGADRFFSESINNLIEGLAQKNLVENESMISLLTAFYKEASYEYGDVVWGSAVRVRLRISWCTGYRTQIPLVTNTDHIRVRYLWRSTKRSANSPIPLDFTRGIRTCPCM